MQRPPADPAKLLDAWMEWERGDATPGRVMATLKTGGLRELLEGLAAGASPAPGTQPPAAQGAAAGQASAAGATGDADAGGWTPVV